MPSTYPAAPDDLTAGNTSLNHGQVSDALAAVQETLGVNPQGDEPTVAARFDALPDGLDPAADQAITGAWDFTSTDPFVGGYVDLVSYTPPAYEDVTPDAAIGFTVTDAGNVGTYTINMGGLTDADNVGVTTVTIYQFPGDDTIYILLPTTGGTGLPEDAIPTTANDVIAAWNASAFADLITAAPAPGNDGTGVVDLAAGSPSRSTITPHVEVTAGIITSPVTIHPDEPMDTPLTLRHPVDSPGGAALNIEHLDGSPNDSNGYGVTHLDADGGGGFASGRIIWSQSGTLHVNGPTGGTVFEVKADGAAVFTAGDPYASLLVSAASDPDIRGLALSGAVGQTADIIEGYSPDVDGGAGGFVFRVTPAGEVHASGGLVLTSPLGVAYRLVVDEAGALSTEAV